METKSKSCNRFFSIMIHVYMTLPFFIFVIGWLKWYWAILTCGLLGFGLISAIRQDDLDYCPFEKVHIWKFVIAIALIALWVYFSGVGGMSYQNRDHGIRTSIFRALVEYEWPVTSKDGVYVLIYYFGYWLPSAVVGKIFGFEIGYRFQAVWAVIGIFLVYYLICVWRKKVSLWPLIVLVLFSGLDYVGAVWLQTYGNQLTITKHIEWWSKGLQFSSNTTQLYWVFNQAIPAWLVTMYLVVNPKNKKSILFLVGSLLLHSAFPFVGILPIVVYFLFADFGGRKDDFKALFSVTNIVGVAIVGGLSFALFLGNASGALFGFGMPMLSEMTIGEIIMKYGLFYLLEFGIYAIILFPREKKNVLFYFIILVLLGCPWIRIGYSMDFCMRASIPALFVLMLFVIRAIEDWASNRKWVALAILLLVMAVGAITPIHEITRSVYKTYQAREEGKSPTRTEVAIEEMLTYPNFHGESGSTFFKIFVK